jgi:hypothetical protein
MRMIWAMRNRSEISLLLLAFFLILLAFSLVARSKVTKICDGDILRAKDVILRSK